MHSSCAADVMVHLPTGGRGGAPLITAANKTVQLDSRVKFMQLINKSELFHDVKEV